MMVYRVGYLDNMALTTVRTYGRIYLALTCTKILWCDVPVESQVPHM